MNTYHKYTQAEMESELRDYFRKTHTVQNGRLNDLLKPSLVSCDAEQYKLTLSYTVEEWMLNPVGMIHGGAIASVMDLTLGLLARFCCGGRMTPTLRLELGFHHAAYLGDTYVVEASLLKNGGTFSTVQGVAHTAAHPETLCASATGMFFTAYDDGHK